MQGRGHAPQAPRTSARGFQSMDNTAVDFTTSLLLTFSFCTTPCILDSSTIYGLNMPHYPSTELHLSLAVTLLPQMNAYHSGLLSKHLCLVALSPAHSLRVCAKCRACHRKKYYTCFLYAERDIVLWRDIASTYRYNIQFAGGVTHCIL